MKTCEEYLYEFSVSDGLGSMQGLFVPINIAMIAIAGTLKGNKIDLTEYAVIDGRGNVDGCFVSLDVVKTAIQKTLNKELEYKPPSWIKPTPLYFVVSTAKLIDCDQLLNGECTWEEVRRFFMDGSFDSEKYLVAAIKKHLLTEDQRKRLQNFTISDVLNGRTVGIDTKSILNEWDKKLDLAWFTT